MRSMLFGAVLFAGFAVPATSQDNQGQPYNFLPAGARALGMGAAFAAVADDATAAASNPAGLIILAKPELSGQLRFLRLQNQTVAGHGGSPQQFVSPSFFSIVIPRGRAALAVAYEEAATYRFRSSGNIVAPSQQTGYQDERDTTARTLGFAIALRLGGRVSIGGGLLGVQYKETTWSRSIVTTTRYYSHSEDRWLQDNTTVGFRLGALVNPTGRVSAGVSLAAYPFRTAGEYSYMSCYARDDTLPYQTPPPCTPLSGGTDRSTDNRTLPGTLSAGMALRPTANWVISAEALWVDTAGGGFNGLHAGVEYTFLASGTPISVRAGGYQDKEVTWGWSHGAKTHGTLGAGVVFKDNYQLDAAFSWSKSRTQGLLSFVARF